ncbi:MAG: hybrid sensor histidine kinase/response regulator [SAR324 cluster bacterium]|nr:hybrid sensor histidine kinase/response regulator [SAR324 cluster bacterium]
MFDQNLLKTVDSALGVDLKEHTILVVDDEEHNLITLSDLLSQDYEVLTATGGLEALQRIKEYKYPNHIHLIISDQRMPGMLGVDFLEQTIPLLPRALRIILTGFTDIEVMIASINQAHIYKFILKPFNQDDMQLTIKRALESYTLEARNLELVEELAKLNMELDQTVQRRTLQLKEALEKLQELNATKDKFFSIIAHETSNAFTSVLMSGELLATQIDQYDPPTIRKMADNIYGSTKRLFRLFENLLDWSKIQVGRIESHPDFHDLDALAKDVVAVLSDNARQKSITLCNEISEQTMIYADYHITSTILRNLLSNAIKFTHPHGTIRIFVKDADTMVEVSVKDDGVGICEDNLKDIFRMDKSVSTLGTKREKGTGLGLTLCKELIDKNQGKIWVESRPNQGSTFTFTIPKETGATLGKNSTLPVRTNCSD